MKKSQIFYGNTNREETEQRLKKFLNEQKDFLSPRTINSPRAVGDAIEKIIAENFKTILGEFVDEYWSSFSRRAMQDLAFTDKDGFYYAVDVKTHRLDTKFNMPNLTSVERLSSLYEKDTNYFCPLKIDYKINNMQAETVKVTFAPIEFFDWDCLRIGALGWGQIQIAKASVVKIMPRNSRKNWMLKLCGMMSDFYPEEITKINKRVNHFKQIEKFWEKKSD